MNKSKRITLATLAGGIAAAASFNAFAHRGGRGGTYGPMDIDRRLQHLYVEIGATEEQKQRLDPIVRQTVKELAPLRQSLHDARREAFGILGQDRVDVAALEALRAKQIQLADQASRAVTRALVDAAEVLNPAQRKQLAAHFSRHRRGRFT
jgi:Spy/CpxP family protein refolding chaperone